MPERFTFDSEPILAFYSGEVGAEVVEGLLQQIQSGLAEGNISIINLAEIRYILDRLDPNLPEAIERKIRLFGLKVVPVDDDDGLWREAADLKSKHPMSLADAFAVATAKASKARLVVGRDREFNGVSVSLLRIRK